MSGLATDIVLISYNTRQLTLKCISTIIDTAQNIICNVIVVDNASTDGSCQAIEQAYPQVTVISNPDNYGYAAAVNIGVNVSRAECVIVANTDVEFLPGSIDALLRALELTPKAAVAGPQQLFPDLSWQGSYRDLPGIMLGLKDLFLIRPAVEALRKIIYNKLKIKDNRKYVPYIDGAVMAIRRQDFEAVGGFDEAYFFYTEEADFCYRLLMLGRRCLFVPDSELVHHRGGSTTGTALSEASIKMLIKSKGIFCNKYFPGYYSRIFYRLELLYIQLMTLLRKLPIGNNNTGKLEELRLLAREWKKLIKNQNGNGNG